MNDPSILLAVIVPLITLPMLAIMGAIIHSIVKTVHQQRLMELARKERIAAIEKGVDPSQLPPLLPLQNPTNSARYTFEQNQLREIQRLKIGGLVCLALGAGIGIPLLILGRTAWSIPGLVFVLLGIALLIGAQIVSPNRSGGRTGP